MAGRLAVDLYAWARELALRVAMRALFGFDPDRRAADLDPAREFERALGYYGREYWLQVLRGPGTPWAALPTRARGSTRLIYGEIARRRAHRRARRRPALAAARRADEGAAGSRTATCATR